MDSHQQCWIECHSSMRHPILWWMLRYLEPLPAPESVRGWEPDSAPHGPWEHISLELVRLLEIQLCKKVLNIPAGRAAKQKSNTLRAMIVKSRCGQSLQKW